MSEQFGFDQALRQGGTTDAHERSFTPRGIVMDSSSHQLLAGARFTTEHDGRVAVGYLADGGEDFHYRLAATDQSRK